MTDGKEDENLGSFYMGKTRTPPSPQRILPKGLMTVLVVAAFGVIVWYAYPQSSEKYSDLDIPVISAEDGTYKFEPENPGGAEIPHQDSTVFDPLEGKQTDSVENIIPPTEGPAVVAAQSSSPLPEEQPALNLAPQATEGKKAEEDVLVIKAQEPAPAQATPPSFPTPAPVVAKASESQPVVPKETKEAKKAPAKDKASSATAATVGDYYIQLGSFRDESSAAKGWAQLQKKHGSLLSGLAMRTSKADLGSKGIFYRLQAGKFTKEKAKETCAALTAAGQGGCLLVK